MRYAGWAFFLFGWIAGMIILGDVMLTVPEDRSYLQSEKAFQDFRAMRLQERQGDKIPEYLRRQGGIEALTAHMLYSRFGTRSPQRGEALSGGLWRFFFPKETIKEYERYYAAILNDIRCFPVLEDTKKGVPLTYEDSWGFARNYGGARSHEGTDIMAGNNKRGYFTVVSVSDGVVEKMGWLELGGYRIGIRSPGGAYFYYAHMSCYAQNLQIGSKVEAGQELGMMGDTGYGKEEGTTGKFDVHLHFGIYFDRNGKEVSVNPYYILRQIESGAEHDSQKK